ncbi:MAG: hypothetical protein ABI813_11395 [Bacteroidota bacterium]
MQRRQFFKNSALAGVGISVTGLNLSAFANISAADKIRELTDLVNPYIGADHFN